MGARERGRMGVRGLERVVNAIFLSASVPVAGRGSYYQTAEPFLIQLAVREFLTLALGRRRIVWGGHPAITPMVWAVCEDLGVEYADSVTLYQSKVLRGCFSRGEQAFRECDFHRDRGER